MRSGLCRSVAIALLLALVLASESAGQTNSGDMFVQSSHFIERLWPCEHQDGARVPEDAARH
jgi:hypothetical protein